MSRRKTRNPMIMFALIKALTGSTTGPRIPCKGSKRPQLSSGFGLLVLLAFPAAEGSRSASASPFRRFPFFSLDPVVPARALEPTPAFSAFTRSLA